MDATFYSFNKRRNSTARPSGGTTLSITIKEASSAINPTIEVQSINGFNYNYCYIPTYGRYYWITDIVYNRTVWTIKCAVDVLATYKSSITSTKAYILYSNAGSTDIYDQRNKPLETYTKASSAAAIAGLASSNGMFVLGVMTDKASISGGLLTTYLFDYTNLAALATQLMSTDFIDQLREKFTADPFEGIMFLNWLPVPESYFNPSITTFTVSGFTVPNITAAVVVNKITASETIEVPIPWGDMDNNYLRCSPFTTLSMYLPYVGTVPLNADMLRDESYVDVDFAIDLALGTIIYRLKYHSTEIVISTYGGSCGASIPISKAQQNTVGQIAGVSAMIGGVAASVLTGGVGGLLSGVGAVTAGAAEAATSLQTQTNINGSLSSRASKEFANIIKINRITRDSEFEPSAIQSSYGLPTFKTMTIGSIGSGYIQTSGAHVAINGTEGESSEINNLLNSGIYLE